MKQKVETIIKHLTNYAQGDESHAGMQFPAQDHLNDGDSIAIAENLNAAFLIALAGSAHPLYSKAACYLDRFESNPFWGKAALFYKQGLELIFSEISERCSTHEQFKRDLSELYSWFANPDNLKNKEATIETIRRLFFPEGAGLCEDRRGKINALRTKRTVSITRLNPDPVSDPAREILFTSNILITIPPESKDIDELPISDSLRQQLKQVIHEEQIFWYDHPVPVGIAPEHNEVLYGLEGLDKAVEFEKERGTVHKDAKVTCVLSVSVTHRGLQRVVKGYLEEELKKEKNIRHLDVYVFTEADTQRLIEEILVPAAEKYSGAKDFSDLDKVIGVDGEYGRHYSFLKAIAAFWQTFIDAGIKGTFKIDLDQVFPQKELVEQSGLSAFEHFKTPLWGAEGTDNEGRNIELGMIGGALVNQQDIGDSLFTPDVCFPPDRCRADELIFFSTLPQALSTEAEMMTRYSNDTIDGKSRCIQRIHVTGGTNGILIDSLRKYRPFTPTFVGRAEDQAYILSVLFNSSGTNLRYVHKDGLIMRHDKEAFASEAIKMAATGKLIGDYIRTLVFSYYVRALPWSFDKIKEAIDPFTGCFASPIPLTVVYLRFALKAASYFNDSSDERRRQGLEFMQTGTKRLHETIGQLTKKPNPLIGQYGDEKQGWNLFYDTLDKIEEGIKQSTPFATGLQDRATNLIRGCKINFYK